MPVNEKEIIEKKPNRLVNETSTYLLQHALNPVDWYPWGPEALELSRRENRPILLSIGYAACHWCHVMEHESFEDPATAEIMNANFVNIKVDREERTDLDEIYMKAVQLITGHGGWPMTVFLTPELAPFFAGTYFPPEDKHGMPSFRRILLGIAAAWKNQHEELVASASEITTHLKEMEALGGKLNPAGEKERIDKNLLTTDIFKAAVEELSQGFDGKWGGFGGAPKFPHSFSLQLCMRAVSDQSILPTDRARYREIVEKSLDQMAMGGIYDQVGGGFARYSVDRMWLVPHFEKMLYDNALLAICYFEGHRLTGSRYWKRIGLETLDFVIRELRTENGAFFSSLDADSEGEEGKFYVWTPAQLLEHFTGRDAQYFADVFGVTEKGNFENGTSVLFLSKNPESLAQEQEISELEFWQRIDPLRARLLEARQARIRPTRDEKVLTGWNSLMISALVEGYRISSEKRYLVEAIQAAEFVLDNLHENGCLLRTWGAGKAKLGAYLDDYACFINACLDLASVDCNRLWLDTADRLCKEMLDKFLDEDARGFYFTACDHEELLIRPKVHFDGSVPSATSMACLAMLRLARLMSKDELESSALRIIESYSSLFVRAPSQFANMLLAAKQFIPLAREIVIILPETPSSKESEICGLVNSLTRPGDIVLVAREGSFPSTPIPFLVGKKANADACAVYICRNYTCEAPLSEPDSIKAALQ